MKLLRKCEIIDYSKFASACRLLLVNNFIIMNGHVLRVRKYLMVVCCVICNALMNGCAWVCIMV